MKKKLLLLLSFVGVSALSSALTLAIVFWQNGGLSKLEQLTNLIGDYYIEETDQTMLEDAAAAAMVEAAGDRWSYYIPASQFDAHVEMVENAYVGIGITITVAHDGSGLQVMEVSPGSPAEEAGLQVDDIIIAIEGQDTAGMTTTDARNLVRGKEGTQVELTLWKDGIKRTVSVTRRKVQVAVAEGRMLDGNVGLVTIENFDDRCASESIAAIEALLEQGAESLIFDVRNNPGGYAHELVRLLDYLLPEGELFRTVNYKGEEQMDTSDAACLDMPMAVLVNGDSYSAAEFFAVALQEYEAAVVVGEKTTGKGYFQSTFHLNDGSAVALSIGKYYTPKGISLEGVGITPDVELPVDDSTYAAIYYDQLEPEEDPQIRAALDCLK
ncbi:MAG: S41 family peptidase [Oscillospiraceae bacterium]|nr:S41 family peptidase [Oscillospiraceae bacterium]MBQ7129701.1 S41 family peptidase [Oscillospiraceae bacterium]